MSGNWPDGWIPALLDEAGIPYSDALRSVFLAWQQSTPLDPWTNNPLGMPAVTGKTAELMTTGYALFPTMGDMRAAFSDVLSSHAGTALHQSLALQDKVAPVYRAIHALPWPASRTETDWPAKVLDLIAQPTRDRLASVSDASQRKTSGTLSSPANIGQGLRVASNASIRAAASVENARRAIQSRLGS